MSQPSILTAGLQNLRTVLVSFHIRGFGCRRFIFHYALSGDDGQTQILWEHADCIVKLGAVVFQPFGLERFGYDIGVAVQAGCKNILLVSAFPVLLEKNKGQGEEHE